MSTDIEQYIRKRAKELGLSLSAVCKQAGISRQTLYGLSDKHPSIATVVALSNALHIHPLKIFQLLFDGVVLTRTVERDNLRGDKSAFARDVTFPDGELVFPNERFTKTWEMHNVGKVTWENRFLQCMDEEIVTFTRTGETLRLANNLIPTVTRVPVPFCAPGQTVQLSVELTAPDAPGTVLSYWKSVFEDGSLCFPEHRGLWVKVRVSTLATGAHADRSCG
jgi:transcriptional regulator with XRE-family HTH domain